MTGFGVSSMVGELRRVLVHRPDDAFAEAYADPAHGYLYPVDLGRSRHEHQEFVDTLTALGAGVEYLDGTAGPDLIYTYDPALITSEGAVLLRPGKPSRRAEVPVIEAWLAQAAIPVLGRLETPATADGGDVFWLRPNLVCVGRSLRTNQAGIEQLTELLPGSVEVFEVPTTDGVACVHLMSAISMLADDLALVDPALLPTELAGLLADLAVTVVEIDDSEAATLAANALAVRPNVIVTVAGNPRTRAKLEAEGVSVHPIPGREICLNGTGGPTCLTRPIWRT